MNKHTEFNIKMHETEIIKKLIIILKLIIIVIINRTIIIIDNGGGEIYVTAVVNLALQSRW